MPRAFADIAFTPKVRAEQKRHGSDQSYARLLSPDYNGGDQLGPREIEFLQARDSLFLSTVSETGWPYVQHRGGRPGFLRVLDETTIGYADYSGNRQYITTGNLRHADKICLIAVDYAQQRRIKLWGRAEISEDPASIAALQSPDDPWAERAMLIRVAAFDWNCPQHIPQHLTEAQHIEERTKLQARIARLEHQLAEAP